MTGDTRPLRDGEALEIGDEYLAEGTWRRLEADEYAEWVSACSHYNAAEMTPFRRPLRKHPNDIARTRAIFAKAGDVAMAGLFAALRDA